MTSGSHRSLLHTDLATVPDMHISILVPLACAGLHGLLVAAHLSLSIIGAYGAEHAVVFTPQVASSVQTYTSLVSQIIIIVSKQVCT